MGIIVTIINVLLILLAIGVVVFLVSHFKDILAIAVVIVILICVCWLGKELLVGIYGLIKDHMDGIIELIEYVVIGGIVLGVVGAIAGMLGDHDKAKKEIRLHRNEEKLYQELRDTFTEKDIGYIRYEDAENMFSHYAKKEYPADKNFHDMLSGFISDLEQQNFDKNKTWADPYVQYVVTMRTKSLQQLLQEVDGPLRHLVHTTPDDILLSEALNSYTERKGVDTPPILTKTTVNGVTIYQPTEYGIRLYNKTLSHSESEEVDFDDL